MLVLQHIRASRGIFHIIFMQEKTIAVVGLGYVGLPLALLAERKGYFVLGIDIDMKKIETLEGGVSPFLDEEVSRHLKEAKHIQFTSDFSAISKAEVVVICVPTPVYENHMPNLEPVIGSSEGIAKYLKKGQLIILESTVNPGVSETVVLPILEKASGLKAGVDFSLAHCPERINPGDKKWNVENINRVVGCTDETGLERTAKFYESIITGSVKRMSTIKAAEAVKVVENSFRDINIAFVNELSRSFTRLGIDVVEVIDGAATKPFAFMAHYPGTVFLLIRTILLNMQRRMALIMIFLFSHVVSITTCPSSPRRDFKMHSICIRKP